MSLPGRNAQVLNNALRRPGMSDSCTLSAVASWDSHCAHNLSGPPQLAFL